MNTLAIETSDRIGSLAAMSDGELVYSQDLDRNVRSAQSLAPGIQVLMNEIDWIPSDVDLVAVGIGPGSFTGLRVAVTTAKTLAMCCRAEILGINTLETIAAAAPGEVQRLSVAIDAQRGQLVVQSFHRDGDGWFVAELPAGDTAGLSSSAGNMQLVNIDPWLKSLPAGAVLSGPILEKLLGRLPAGVTALPSHLWRPTAANAARLAARQYAAGRRDDVWALVPIYSRKSAAEEKLETQAT